jgi:hypothetical protein
MMSAQLAAAAIGIWLMAAPTVLGYSGIASMIEHIAGPIIAAIAIVAASECTRGVRWANVAVASMLIVAPLWFDHARAATFNSLVSGAAVAVLSTLRSEGRTRFGGGWRVLLKGGGDG